ncbi:TIGR00288 family protein [Allopseudospirillum japonicum]|uniref:TIGR00288 family protein n=1 Tax=Allopseudospirillum japonicum TaxID=64971 RepID=A0A1H6TUM3_9GAMM|nr:NYN domain-containing protein [Allopseudospirillum japonicum]SEI83749.1 TIGR00288 family protein [Allopseudospirillum japonicum]
MDTESRHNIAIFIDIENVIISATEEGLEFDIEPVLEKLSEYGRIVYRRAFGDLVSTCTDKYKMNRIRRMLQQHYIQFEDIPYLSRHKNTADIRLVVDALSLSYAQPAIDTIAIFSSDRDYMPLVAKLRELGKNIIGIGSSIEATNKHYVNSFDEFFYYTSFFDQGYIPAGDNEALMRNYKRLVCKAVVALSEKGKKPVGAALMLMIKQLRPDFDLRLIGLTGFRGLADLMEEEKLIQTTPHGGDILIELQDEAFTWLEKNEDITHLIAKDGNLVEGYKRYIRNKLKCELPSFERRQQIYLAAENVIHSSVDKGETLGLSSIADQVTQQLDWCDDNVVFKLLYGIFRKFAFKVELGVDRYNPVIKGIQLDKSIWDDLFIENMIAVMVSDDMDELNPEALAELFGVNVTLTSKIVATL